MAKAKKAKVKKVERSTQLPLDDRRWRPVAEIVERLVPHIGDKGLTAHDLTEVLVSGEIRSMRRSIRTGHVDVDKLCDIELERQILGEPLLNEPSVPEHFIEPFARVRAPHRVVTPKRIIAAMGGDAGMVLVNGITLGQYVERLVAEVNLPLRPGHRELMPASCWAEHCLACSPNGKIGVGFRFPPYDHGPSEPSSTLTATWAFFLWEPDCVKVWPALAPQTVAAREPEASEPLGRKPGPRAKKEWKLFIAYKLYILRKEGKPQPTAGELAELCQAELDYLPDESAINLWLRELGRLPG